MKKLYILLLVLILVYINVNLAYTYLNPEDGFTNLFANDEKINENDTNTITIGTSTFEKLANFENSSIDTNAVSLYDSGQELTINVSEIDNSQDLSETVNNLLINDNSITSNQTLVQNGANVYYLYAEGTDGYNAVIYFNKDGKNYLIKGNNIDYDESDYFINSCKDIINPMSKKEESGLNNFK